MKAACSNFVRYSSKSFALQPWAPSQHKQPRVLFANRSFRDDSGVEVFRWRMWIWFQEYSKRGLTRLFIELIFSLKIYKGYVDDPRNTDNAWMETVAVNFHDEDGSSLSRFPLEAGSFAKFYKMFTYTTLNLLIDWKSPAWIITSNNHHVVRHAMTGTSPRDHCWRHLRSG